MILDIPANEWLTANGRDHHHVKARKTKALRYRAATTARSQKLTVESPTFIAVKVGYPTASKADPDNAQPTVKACVDGLVDARVLPDDNSEHVVGILYMRGPKCPKGVHRLEFIFTSQLVPF